MENKIYYIYISTNVNDNVLYVGVTSNLPKRMYEHKDSLVEGFSQKYKVNKLVYYETTNDINSAIRREKQLKNWRREWKINLIRDKKPGFAELFIGWCVGVILNLVQNLSIITLIYSINHQTFWLERKHNYNIHTRNSCIYSLGES